MTQQSVITKNSNSCNGFTLLELLVVIGIMVMLAATLIIASSGGVAKAKRTGTIGTINQLSMAMQQYYNEFRAYPPDGYDETVTAPNGKVLKGSACLTYYLAWKYADNGDYIDFDMLKPDYSDPDNVRMIPANNQRPYWKEVKPKEYLNSSGEIIDKWNNPLRYDNCKTGKDGQSRYSPNAEVINPTSDPDPREENNNGKPFNPTSYDLWSCGADGNTDESSCADDIIHKN